MLVGLGIMHGKKRTLLDCNEDHSDREHSNEDDRKTDHAETYNSDVMRTPSGAPRAKVQRTKYQEQLLIVRTVLGTPGILPSIFSFLSTRTKKAICTMVCKEWNVATKDPLAWHTITVSAENHYDCMISFEEARCFLGNLLLGVQKLELDGVFSGEKMQALLNKCPNVQIVRIPCTLTFITLSNSTVANQTKRFLSCFCFLFSMQIHYAGTLNETNIEPICSAKQLKILHCNHAEEWSSTSIQTILSSCHRIEQMRLKMDIPIQDYISILKQHKRPL
jgi:hypothetical protein